MHVCEIISPHVHFATFILLYHIMYIFSRDVVIFYNLSCYDMLCGECFHKLSQSSDIIHTSFSKNNELKCPYSGNTYI